MSVQMRVLVVEDDRDSADFLDILLSQQGYLVKIADSGAVAREALAAWKADLVLMDMRLPDVEDLQLLREFRQADPDVQIIMMSGHGSIAKAVEAMATGALTFIEKPVEAAVVLAMLTKAAEKRQLSTENRRLRASLEEYTAYGNIIARSKPMRQLFQMMNAVAPTDASVLIHGENGTGKELIATAIHQQSLRAKGPLVKVNCAAIPAELVESELFGHKRGSFTGAVADKPGLMELAENGTLFLDEIGEMAPNLQVKLLRVLQDKEFRPVGGTKTLKANFRLICATNVNLDAARSNGKLREDLYFRINTVTISVPALRARPEDILLLAERFLERFRARHDRPGTALSDEVAQALLRYPWPGNVRELEHAVERAVIMAQEPEITLDDFPPALRKKTVDSGP